MTTTTPQHSRGLRAAAAGLAGALILGSGLALAPLAPDDRPAERPPASQQADRKATTRTVRLPVLSANLYVNNQRRTAAAATIRKERPVVVGLQEARKARDFAPAGYRKVVQRRPVWASQNPVLVRKDATVVSRSFHQLTGRVGPEYGNDAPRWVTIVTVSWRGEEWAVLNTHLTPRPRARGNGPEYRAGLETLFDLAEKRTDAGKHVVIVGDLNERPRSGNVETWKWCPCVAFARYDFAHVRNVVDYVAAAEPATVGKVRLVDRARTGSDHTWLGATVTVKVPRR